MSTVESRIAGLLLVYRHGSHLHTTKMGNALNQETKMGNVLDQETKTDNNALNQQTKMSNVFDQQTMMRNALTKKQR